MGKILRVRGVEAAVGANNERVRKLGRGLNTAIRRALVDIFREVQGNFASSGQMGGAAWKPLGAATLAQKRRQGYSSKPLIRTGNLRQAWDIVMGTAKGKLESQANYGAYHQHGTKHIPARPFVPKEARLRDYALRHLKLQVSEAVG